MLTYVCDGTLPGLFCACVCAQRRGEMPDEVILPTDSQPLLMGETREIQTQSATAASFARRLKEKGGRRCMKNISYCYLSEDVSTYAAVIAYALGVEVRGKEMDSYHAHPAVARVHDVSGKVSGEIHRFTGLLRFRELEDGTFFAPFSPDYNIVVPLSLHFTRRLGDQEWIIYDVQRDTGVTWNGRDTRYVTAEESLRKQLHSGAEVSDDAVSENEKVIRNVWRKYFTEIAVEGRENSRLQSQYMPRRYWAYLVERPGSSRSVRRAK